MAVTRKPPHHVPHQPLPEVLRGCLASLVAPGTRLCVALSGGRDSVAMLHALQDLRHIYPLSVIHVNHGLSPHADAWQAFCQQLCLALAIPFHAERVVIDPADPRGIEAAARAERRRVFAGQPADCIVLAQHQDDQAETVLLQLLRGAGVKGLAGMPQRFQSGEGPVLLRPLLDYPRPLLEQWARERQLAWVEDESNLDSRYQRNFLRHDVLPVIATHYPGWREALARSAALLADADGLLTELAQLDAATAVQGNRLHLVRLRALSWSRARNLLRHFLHIHRLTLPSAARLDDMLRQLLTAAADREIGIRVQSMVLCRYREEAWLVDSPPILPASLHRLWTGEARLDLPELGGRLLFSAGSGLRLPSGPVLQVHLRKGGEMFRPQANRPEKPLKALLQEIGMPPWERRRLPLLWHDGQLVCVPGVGIAADWQCRPGEAGVEIRWEMLPADEKP